MIGAVVLGRALDDSFEPVVRHNVTALTVTRLGANALYRFAPPFLAVIARGLDVTIAELGIALTIAETCGLTSPLIGRFVDRVSRRASMVGGLAGLAVGALIVASSPHVVVFAAGLFVLSMAKIVYDVGQGSWITDHVPFARRGRVVGLTETSWALGLLVGVSSMGLIAGAASWSWAYVAGGAFVTVMAVVLWRRLGPDPPGRRPAASSTGVAVRLGRSGWMAVAAMVAMAAASQSMFVTFGTWLEDDHGFSATALAAVTFSIGGLELLASSLSTARTDRWGKERSVIAGAGVMVVAALGFIALTDVLPVSLVLLGAFIASFEFAIVSMIPIGGELVPGRPAAGISRFLAASAVGRSLATIPATSLYDHAGVRSSAALGGALAVVLGALMALRDPTSPGGEVVAEGR